VFTEHTLEALIERYEKLVIHRSKSNTLTEAHRRLIADKFANKSLQELHAMVRQLDDASTVL